MALLSRWPWYDRVKCSLECSHLTWKMRSNFNARDRGVLEITAAALHHVIFRLYIYIYICTLARLKKCHDERRELRPVSTTSVEKSILCLFYCFFFALASILTARFNRRSIKERKNALFHARSGNGPLSVDLAWSTAKDSLIVLQC